MKQIDTIGFGALNMDKLYRVNKIATAEEESFVIDFKEACGGSAANTVVGMAKLGCKVGFIGKVADDREGRMLLDDFRREDVDTTGVIIAGNGRSGTAMGFVDDKGERALYVDPGVNDTIEFDEVNREYTFQTRFLHLTSFVGEKSFQTQKRLVEALPNSVRISLDIGELYARKGMEALEPMLSKTFVAMPNSKELRILTRKTDYKRSAELLLEKGAEIVAVKLGGRGCYVTNGKESRMIEAFRVKAVDTTGAGDSFCAGFLYGLISSKNLYECGRLGNFVASKCITKIGARAGLPTLKDLIKNNLA